MNQLLHGNEWQWRLSRTMLQGVLGVFVANMDLLIGVCVVDPAWRPFAAALVMAAQGSAYTNPCFREQCEAALAAGRLLGCYMYVAGTGAKGEAKRFAAVAGKYVGKAVLAVVWEADQNARFGDLAYLEQVVREVIKLTGVRPMIYASVGGYPWAAARELDSGTWVAQYADDDATGYQAKPWNEALTPARYGSTRATGACPAGLAASTWTRPIWTRRPGASTRRPANLAKR